MSEKEQFSEVSKEELKLRRAKLRKQASRFRIAMWLIAAVSLILMGVALYFYRTKFPGTFSDDHERWGTFGDFLGGSLNPIFALFSFIALLWTIKQQNETILLSADELELTRQELEGSKKAQEDMAEAATLSANVAKQQSEMLKLQQFESTFYSLLEQHNALLDKAEFSVNKLVNEFEFDANKKRKDNFDRVSIRQLKTLVLNNKDLSNYFRVLYQLLKYIAIHNPYQERKITKVKRLPRLVTSKEKMYSSIVRAYVPVSVLPFLAANCYCHRQEGDTFFDYYLLLERYAFLEHLVVDEPVYLSRRIPIDVQTLGHKCGIYWAIFITYDNALGKSKNERIEMIKSLVPSHENSLERFKDILLNYRNTDGSADDKLVIPTSSFLMELWRESNDE